VSDSPSEPILLLSTADWDAPLWTNKQHVARELARRGHTVIYVESLGLRRPSPVRRDFSRLWRRLRRGLAPAREVEPRLWVCGPLVLPLHGWPGVAALNRLLLGAALAAAERRARVRPRWLLTYSPLTPRLLDLSRFERVAYHAVDDIAAQPGMPAAPIETAERELVSRASVVFTTSPALQARHAALNRNTHFFPNVVDADHFAQGAHAAPPSDIAGVPGPRVGFVGAISAYKLDLPLVAAVAALRPGYSFVLIGPVGEGDPSTDVSALRALPNVHLLGARSYAELPACLAGFDVAILPCPLTAYTRAMFPMKFFEYLAASRTVVATPLPALADFAHLFQAAEAPEAFARALDRAIAGEGPPVAAGRAEAQRHTWAIRTGAMLTAIAAAPPPRAQ